MIYNYVQGINSKNVGNLIYTIQSKITNLIGSDKSVLLLHRHYVIKIIIKMIKITISLK